MSVDAAVPTPALEETAPAAVETEATAVEGSTNENIEHIICSDKPGPGEAAVEDTLGEPVPTMKDSNVADSVTDSNTAAAAHEGTEVKPESLNGDGGVGDGGEGEGGGTGDIKNEEAKDQDEGKTQQSTDAENLSAAVRARLDEVMHSEEDQAMRVDARLIKFLREVEESQVQFAEAAAGAAGYHSVSLCVTR